MVLDPFERNAAPRPAIAVQLASLNGDPLFGAARIASNLLNWHLEDVLENSLVGVARAAHSSQPHVHAADLLELGQRLHAHRMPDIADGEVLADAADPIEFAEIE